MPRIRDLQVQFHLIEGEDSELRYEAIAELLSETHTATWECPFVWENWRRDDGEAPDFRRAALYGELSAGIKVRGRAVNIIPDEKIEIPDFDDRPWDGPYDA